MEFSSSEYWSGGSLSLLQIIFPTRGSNPGLLHCRQILYQLSYQGKKVKSLSPTIRDSMGYSPPGSSIHGIFQARILEWVASSFSRRSS